MAKQPEHKAIFLQGGAFQPVACCDDPKACEKPECNPEAVETNPQAEAEAEAEAEAKPE